MDASTASTSSAGRGAPVTRATNHDRSTSAVAQAALRDVTRVTVKHLAGAFETLRLNPHGGSVEP